MPSSETRIKLQVCDCIWFYHFHPISFPTFKVIISWLPKPGIFFIYVQQDCEKETANPSLINSEFELDDDFFQFDQIFNQASWIFTLLYMFVGFFNWLSGLLLMNWTKYSCLLGFHLKGLPNSWFHPLQSYIGHPPFYFPCGTPSYAFISNNVCILLFLYIQ